MLGKKKSQAKVEKINYARFSFASLSFTGSAHHIRGKFGKTLQHQLKVEKKEFSKLSKSAFSTFKGHFELEKPKVWFKAWGCGEVGPGRSQLIARKSVRQKLPNCTLALCCALLVVQTSELFWPQCSVKHFPNFAFTPTYITMLFNALTLDLFLGMDFCST